MKGGETMAEDYPKPSSAWVVAEVLDLKPLPQMANGEPSTLCEAEVKVRVLVKAKDAEILNGDEINKGDLVSGFFNLEFRKNDPKKTNIYFGGIRKYVPKAEREPVPA
jgi:hypothetical protein